MTDNCYREECDGVFNENKRTYFVLKNLQTGRHFVPATIASILPKTFKLFLFCTKDCRNRFLASKHRVIDDETFETYMDDIMKEYKDLYERLGEK